MKGVVSSMAAAVLLLLAGAVSAQTSSPQEADSTDAVMAPSTVRPADSAPSEPRIYYGGAVGFSFWNDYTRISIEPLVGYKLTPKLSLGGRVRYEYFNDKRGTADRDSHNYGASIFSRYRLVPQLYAHAEYAYMSFDNPGGRDGVPFLFLGGGYSKPMGKRAWAYAEVLFDVIQDEKSPYDNSEPRVSFGVGVGF